MEIGTISNIYLLIFLPLFASLLCQIFQIKNICFVIALTCIVILIGLILKIFPDILIYEKIKNDYELSLLSITFEFSLDLIGVIFLFLIILLEFLMLIFYRSDIESALNKRNQSNSQAFQWLSEHGYCQALVIDHENYILLSRSY